MKGCGRKIGPYDCCTVVHGDCLDVMAEMPDNSVNLIVTSPPYNLGMMKKGSFYAGKEKKGDILLYGDYKDNLSLEDYFAWQRQVLSSCWNLLKESGIICYNHKPRIQNGIFSHPYAAFEHLPLRQEIIWHRGGGHNFSGAFFLPNTERIYLLAKPEFRPNKEYLGYGEVWQFAPETNNPHPAPFPIMLAQRCILSCSSKGNLIFDPYIGSGTTAKVAMQEHRHFFGCDINPEYITMARERLNTVQLAIEL